MATKAQVYAKLAEDTARKITASYLDWAAFLNTSSRLYKYPYNDQLLIYAQRQDATACAEYDLWNSAMRRYVRRGAKGIALLSPGANGMSVRYVFDVSDTARAQDSGAWNPGRSPGKWNRPSGRCLKRFFMRTPPWASPRSWSRLPASRRSPTGAITGGTSSTALTVPSFRSTMNSTSERRFARLQRPASPTACRRDAVWNRSCFGRTSPRCMTGIPLRPSRSLARLSA